MNKLNRLYYYSSIILMTLKRETLLTFLHQYLRVLLGRYFELKLLFLTIFLAAPEGSTDPRPGAEELWGIQSSLQSCQCAQLLSE